MIKSRRAKEGIIVECGGKPEQLIGELLAVTNAVIVTLSRADCNGVVPRFSFNGVDGHLYDAEAIDAMGDLLLGAISEIDSPIWDGMFV